MLSRNTATLFLFIAAIIAISTACFADVYKIPGTYSGQLAAEVTLPLALSQSGEYKFLIELSNPNRKVNPKEPWLTSDDNMQIEHVQVQILNDRNQVAGDNFFEFKGRYRNDEINNSRRINSVYANLNASSSYKLHIKTDKAHLHSWIFKLKSSFKAPPKMYYGMTVMNWLYLAGTIIGLLFILFVFFMARQSYLRVAEQMKQQNAAEESQATDASIPEVEESTNSAETAEQGNFCRHCGTRRVDSGRFCSNCGKE